MVAVAPAVGRVALPLSVLASSLLLADATCLPGHLQGARRNTTVQFISRGWAAHDLDRLAAAIVLEELAGFEVEKLPLAVTQRDVMPLLVKGPVVVDMEQYGFAPSTPFYKQHVEEDGTIMVLGNTGYSGYSGLFVFNDTLARYPADFYKFFQPKAGNGSQAFDNFVRFGDVDMTGKDFCKFGDMCTGSSHIPPACQSDPANCPVMLSPSTGWDTAAFENRIVNNNMAMVTAFVGWDYDQDGGEVLQLYKDKKDVAFYNYVPNTIFAKLEATRVEFPASLLSCPPEEQAYPAPMWCQYPETTLKIVGSATIRKHAPELIRIMERFTITMPGVKSMIKDFVDTGDLYNSACSWVRAQTEQYLLEVVPPCIRKPVSQPVPGNIVFNTDEFQCLPKLGPENCTNGTLFIASPDRCVCGLGQFQAGDSCEACPAGRFSSFDNLGATECKECPPGSYATIGQASCRRCDKATYQPQAGQGSCIACERVLASSTTEYLGAAAPGDCVCAAGSYQPCNSSGPACESCLPCPKGMLCPLGSSMVNFDPANVNGRAVDDVGSKRYPTLLPKHYSDASDPLSVFVCLNDRRCPGGDPGTCLSNGEGRACALCADGFHSSPIKCTKCVGLETSAVLFPVLPIAIATLVICVLYKTSGGGPRTWNSWRNGMSTLALLLLNHWQMVAMGKATNVKPDNDSISDTFIIASYTEDVTTLFSFDCAGYAGFRAAFLARTATPLILLAIVLCTYAASQLLKCVGIPAAAMEFDRLVNVYFSIVYTFFTGIVSLSLSLFKCAENPNGEETLVVDLSVICGSDEWSQMLGVAFAAVAVYCVGSLSLFARIIFMANAHAGDPSFQKRWKFLFNKYRPNRQWWSLPMLGKSVLLNVGSVATTNEVGQLYWLILAAMLYTCATVRFSPWRFRNTSGLDVIVHLNVCLFWSLLSWFCKHDAQVDKDVGLFAMIVSYMSFVGWFGLTLVILFPPLRSYLFPDQTATKQNETMASVMKASKFVASITNEQLAQLVDAMVEYDSKSLEESALVVNSMTGGETNMRVVRSSLASSFSNLPERSSERSSAPASERSSERGDVKTPDAAPEKAVEEDAAEVMLRLSVEVECLRNQLLQEEAKSSALDAAFQKLKTSSEQRPETPQPPDTSLDVSTSKEVIYV